MLGRIRAEYVLRERNRGENATNNGEYMLPTMGSKCNLQREEMQPTMHKYA